MRNILAFLGALLLTLLAVGWYENWFQVRTTPGTDGNRKISIDIDSTKVTSDIEEAEHKVQTFVEEEAKKSKAAQPSTQPAKDKAPAVGVKDTAKDSKFELNFFGPSGKN